MSITDRLTNAVPWRPLTGRHRRAFLLGGISLATLVASAYASTPATYLTVESFTATAINEAYLDNTYNFLVSVHVIGPDPVLITDTRALDPSPGLVDRDPFVGWACGYAPWLSASSDDLRAAPDQRLWLATERPIRADQGRCPYLNVRVVPTRKGVLRLSGFEVTYRVGSHTRTARLEYEITFYVDHEGVDPQTP